VKIEILDEGFRPLVVSARRVLILADDGVTPIAVAAEYQPGMYCLSHCKDGPAFNATLKSLGVAKRVQVDSARPRDLAAFKLPSH